MIAELGLVALWLSAALAVLQMVSGGLGLAGGDNAKFAIYARPAAVVQAFLAVLAFFLLLWAFAITDLSIKLVATNSHSAKPFIYKLTGTWGNHEGSMLLWVGVLALSGGLLAGLERRLPEKTMSATLAVQGFVALGFYSFLLLSSNPFERLPVPALEGSGVVAEGSLQADGTFLATNLLAKHDENYVPRELEGLEGHGGGYEESVDYSQSVAGLE